jgi:hypothetical protein
MLITCAQLTSTAGTPSCACVQLCCTKITEAEAVVSVNEKKWLVMHVHV